MPRKRIHYPWSLENFNDGYVNADGRFRVWLPNHPRVDLHGYVYRTIVAYEAYHGVVIPLNKMIHHLDGNKLNDSKENLRLATRQEHSKYHDLGEKSRIWRRKGEKSPSWKGDSAKPVSKYMRVLREKKRAIAEGRLTPEIEAEYERAKIEARPQWVKEAREKVRERGLNLEGV